MIKKIIISLSLILSCSTAICMQKSDLDVEEESNFSTLPNEIYELILESKYPENYLKKINCENLTTNDDMDTDIKSISDTEKINEELILNAISLNEFLSEFKSMILVNKKFSNIFKEFLKLRILNLNPKIKKRLFDISNQIDLKALKSFLLTVKLTDLPSELLEFIISLNIDFILKHVHWEEIVFLLNLKRFIGSYSINKQLRSLGNNLILRLLKKEKRLQLNLNEIQVLFNRLFEHEREGTCCLLILIGIKPTCVYIRNSVHSENDLLSAAVIRNYKKLCECLLSREIDVDNQYIALWHAVSNNNIEMVKLLLSYGVNVNSKYEGIPVLKKALGCGHIKMAKFLIAQNADVNNYSYNYLRAHRSPILHEIVKGHDHKSSVKSLILLLDNGADINATDSWGWSALMHAASKGNVDAVRLLLNRGALTDIKSNLYDKTALALAKDPEIKRLIKGKEPKKKDTNCCCS